LPRVAIDPTKKPKTIDFTPDDGPEKGKTFLGISESPWTHESMMRTLIATIGGFSNAYTSDFGRLHVQCHAGRNGR
jgi:hypothetical protein